MLVTNNELKQFLKQFKNVNEPPNGEMSPLDQLRKGYGDLMVAIAERQAKCYTASPMPSQAVADAYLLSSTARLLRIADKLLSQADSLIAAASDLIAQRLIAQRWIANNDKRHANQTDGAGI